MPDKIVRLEPKGPEGKLVKPGAPFKAEWMATDQPVTHGYRYIDDVASGVWVGVWEATPFTMTPHLYSYNEFQFVQEGSVTLVNTSGGETTIRAGECFVVPQGWDGYWKQTEYVRKFSFGFKNAAWEPTDQTSPQVIKLDPKLATEVFVDVSGQFAVGVCDTTASHRKAVASTRHEWMHILEGSVTVTDDAGTAHGFSAGDTFLVPLGTVCDWTCTEYLRAIYCHFQPNAQAAEKRSAALR